MMKQILEAIQPSTTSSTNEPLEDQGHADAFTSLGYLHISCLFFLQDIDQFGFVRHYRVVCFYEPIIWFCKTCYHLQVLF